MEDLDPRFIAFVYAKRGMGRVDWLGSLDGGSQSGLQSGSSFPGHTLQTHLPRVSSFSVAPLWVERYRQTDLTRSPLSVWLLPACYTVLFLVSVSRKKQKSHLQGSLWDCPVPIRDCTEPERPHGHLQRALLDPWALLALWTMYIFSACLVFSPENSPFWIGCRLCWPLFHPVPFSFKRKSAVSEGIWVDCATTEELSGWR